ncbi:protein arginine N-methyltransferase PRMT10-like [Pyrus ussuriensis x Pyrus communis]|uniref:Protein arginine N-methyltransferase PRMT10-like n=1 Tax=Pyrus ussuriensis x Pyrus communis TaxID=2448454 RepID=A0A5N5HZH9_9ROSA|nr:protein arginine N-methyltransferase PRMT10-like [Pyrus ussuriensis x Pyrus communis]
MLYLAMEVVLVLENGVVVSVHADSIGELLLLVVAKGIGADVVGEVDAFLHQGAANVAIAGAALVPATAAVSDNSPCPQMEVRKKKKKETERL